MNVPGNITARIAMLEGRMAGFEARVGGRGGGRVGAMDEALAAASATASSPTAAQPVATAFSLGATSAGGPAITTANGDAGEWSRNLPAAGQRFAPDVEAAADRHGIDPALLGALVWTESGFDPGAGSPAGAIGLGQLMPATAAELGVDPTDPRQNLDGAARYLRTQLDRFGDTKLALAAYNAGPARVAAAGGVPAIEETTNYVARVTERAALLGARS